MPLDPETDFDEEVQLWAIAPSGGPLEKVAVAEEDGFTSVISAGMNMGSGRLDHPRVAAHSLPGGLIDQVVISFNLAPTPDRRVGSLIAAKLERNSMRGRNHC
jgi:hypothetical protein